MNELESRVLAAADAHQQELYDVLSELVRVNTENHLSSGNEKNLVPYLTELFSGLGLAPDTFSPMELPRFSEHPQYFPGHHLEDRPNVCAVWPGTEGKRRIMVAGHIDTVPIGDEAVWSDPPLGGVIRGGKIYGRGSGDNKSGIATLWYAAHILKMCGVRLRDDVVLTAYCDEESGGSHGALAAALKYPCDIVLNLDGCEQEINTHCAGGGCYSVAFAYRRASTDTTLPLFKAVSAFIREYEAFGETQRAIFAADPVFSKSDEVMQQAYRLCHVELGGADGVDLTRASVDFTFFSLLSREEADARLNAILNKLRPELDALEVDAGPLVHTTRYFLTQLPERENPAVRCFRDALTEVRGEPARVVATALGDTQMFGGFCGGEAFAYGVSRTFTKDGGAHAKDEYIECRELLRMAKTTMLYLLRDAL